MAPEKYFDSRYFAWQGERAERSARAVAPLLLDLLAPSSVVDAGCGTGAWLQVLAESGAEVVGIDRDAPPEQLRIPRDAFVAGDLAAPPSVHRTFDLALCLEVAHYLPAESAPALIAYLTGLAPIALFGAAIPGQGGGPGLNRRWPAYWADLFGARGFACCDWLRPLVWEDEQVDWWYAQNTLLYVRRDRLAELPGLRAGRPLPLVHPGLLAETLQPSDANDEAPGRLLRRVLRR